MLIACVKTGKKYGEEYVHILQSCVKRHLPPNGGHEFVCFTDEAVPGALSERLPADLPGWWAKMGLFKLREPLIYFDLDVVITGTLGRLLDWDGFGIIKDWWLPGFNSSVMKLTGDEGDVWDSFDPALMARFYMGDQHFISHAKPEGQTFPPGWFPSYKASGCFDAPPGDAMAVIFHGDPKPPQVGGWVKDYWRRSIGEPPKHILTT